MWRRFPVVFAASLFAAVIVAVCVIEQLQGDISEASLLHAAIVAALTWGGLFAFHSWKSLLGSEWFLFFDANGVYINPRPSSRYSGARGELEVVQLAYQDIESARSIEDITKLYPGSFRRVEKFKNTCLELTIKDDVTAELGECLKELSCGEHLRDLVIVPVMLNDKALVVHWCNEDLKVFPTCAAALQILGENGVKVEDSVTICH